MSAANSYTTKKPWMYTSGGNHYSKRRRIAKRKKAAIAWFREILSRHTATLESEK